MFIFSIYINIYSFIQTIVNIFKSRCLHEEIWFKVIEKYICQHVS